MSGDEGRWGAGGGGARSLCTTPSPFPPPLLLLLQHAGRPGRAAAVPAVRGGAPQDRRAAAQQPRQRRRQGARRGAPRRVLRVGWGVWKTPCSSSRAQRPLLPTSLTPLLTRPSPTHTPTCLQDAFFKQLRTASDGFGLVAEFFGKGLLNNTSVSTTG